MKRSFILSMHMALGLSPAVLALRGRRTQDNMRIVNDCRFCFSGVSCINLIDFPGNFVCQGCPLGYNGDGVSCIMWDECVEDQPCFPDEQGGFCVDKAPDQGRFSCGCRNGYDAIVFDPILNHPIACLDRDECTLQEDDCDENVGICTNTPGGFQCSCPAGFEGDGKTCTEIPEEVVLTPCEVRNCDPVSSVCILEENGNGEQEAVCICNHGYLQIGHNAACNDENECSSDPCGENTQCFNQQGSFLCICNSGFTGNALQGCGDADECSNDQNDCDGETEVCINTQGGFECVSQPSSSPTGTPTIAPTPQPTVPQPQPLSWKPLGQTVMGQNFNVSDFGERVALSADGRTLAVSAEFDIDPATDLEVGSVSTYRLIGNTWNRLGSILYGHVEGAEFGEDMDISADGNTLVDGADCDNSHHGDRNEDCDGPGFVSIFRLIGGEWDLVGGESIFGEFADGGFGGEVDVSADGSVVVITTEQEDMVDIYKVEGNTWELLQNINGSDGTGKDFHFGSTATISGDGLAIAIGSSEAENSAGLAVGSVTTYTFNSITGVYDVLQVLFGDGYDGEEGNFGRSVALSSDGSILAVGDDGNDNEAGSFGEAGVYKLQSGGWAQLGQTLSGDTNADSFGDAVSLNAAGDILAVSSDDGLGYVRVFRVVGNIWEQLGQELVGIDELTDDCDAGEFGSEISLSATGLVLAVGIEESGATSVFRYA